MSNCDAQLTDVAPGRNHDPPRRARRTGLESEAAILLCAVLAVIFLWFGGMKFTGHEAARITPLVAHGPIVSWLHALAGVPGASYVTSAIELATAVALLGGTFNPRPSGWAATASLTCGITLTFCLGTSGVAEPIAGGRPAISASVGQFLLTDWCSLLRASVRANPCQDAKLR